MKAASLQPKRWPLGWLAFVELAMVAGFWLLVGLWHYHEHFYYTSGCWSLLLPLLWLVLAGLSALALVLLIKNLIWLRGWRALCWFLVMSFAATNCLAGLLPLGLSLGMGTTTEVPKED